MLIYYLRGLSARASRIKEKRIEKLGEDIKPVAPIAEEVLVAEVQAAAAEQAQAQADAAAAPAPAAEKPAEQK